jgi:hypothetical protein
LSEDEVNLGIWKVKMAALDNGTVVPIMDMLRFGNFRRVAVPESPLPFLGRAGDITGDMYKYECNLDVHDKALQVLVKKYCNEEGRFHHGTSPWFENVTDHRSRPDELVFS